MKSNRNLFVLLLMILVLLLIAKNVYNLSLTGNGSQLLNGISENMVCNIPSPVESIPPEQLTVPDLILLGAREEAINGTIYDASYQVIDYPGGDVPSDRGACTDVVIRAFRHAGIDIQQLIHQDMLAEFYSYPQNWGLKAADSNIDHRRVPNQVTFMRRFGKSLSLDPVQQPQDWHWGDVVYWKFPNGDEHCGIVSDRISKNGIPLVIHNAGICKEEDALLQWKITGHYRYP